MDSTTTRGVLLASAVAALFVACGGANATNDRAPTAAEMAGKVKCTGINECRGKGVCAQATHKCGGKNECRGQGITLCTANECETRGGAKL